MQKQFNALKEKEKAAIIKLQKTGKSQPLKMYRKLLQKDKKNPGYYVVIEKEGEPGNSEPA